MKKWRSLHVVALTLLHALAAFSSLQAAPPQGELVAACGRGDLAAAQRLLKAGAKINDTDGEGRTPLLAALFSRKEALVVWALKNGADANLSARCPEWQCRGHAGLVGAVRTGEPRMVRLLLDAKADVAADDDAAARQSNIRGSAEILRMLRAAGGSETGAATAASPAKRGTGDSQPAPSGLSTLLPAGPATTRKAGAKLRVAIIAEDALRSAADLLAASLASSPFELIERAELNRILDEHKLTTQFGADGARVAELGALLGADALVLLRKVQLGETSSAEMRFVRVSPGIVLDSAYRPWPLADASAWATDAAARLANLNPKFRDEHAIAIATAPFRPLTDSPSATSLARESLLLLNDRLTHQAGVVLLERGAVDAVSREQSIGKAGGFWAGSYLLDGTVEPATSTAGQTAITLRLAPIGPGETKTFTARGARAELPRLVSDLTTQAAAALKLRAAPPSDLNAEAQRLFDESRNLAAVGLLPAAHRAAETAAAFGLDTDEFIEWRLDTASRLIDLQVQRFGGPTMLHGVRWNGWKDEWVEERMKGVEWLRPAEWCDLGVSAVRLWQRLLVSALRADAPARVAALLERDKSPVSKAFSVHESLDLAATTIDHGDMHVAIQDALRETFAEALTLADSKPVHAATADALAIQIARTAAKLYRDPASLTAAFSPLLARRFSTAPFENRLNVRIALIGLNNLQHAWAARDALRKNLFPRESIEDELTQATLEYFATKDPKQQSELSDKLLDLFWQRRQFFVETQGAIRLFSVIRQDVARFGYAPKFAWHSDDTPQSHLVYTPEMAGLQLKLFLLIARDSAHPADAFFLHDEYYHPAGEDAAEIARLYQRAADDKNGRLKSAAAPAAPKASRPAMRGTPSYAKYPPLKVARRLAAEPTPHGRLDETYVDAPTFDNGANTVWFYGAFTDEKAVHGYAFEVSLPSLKTTTWPLPPVDRPPSKGAIQMSDTVHLYPTSDRLYLAKAEQFLAIGDRKTRAWKVTREVQPEGDFVKLGDALFFLTRSGGARGLATLSLRDQSITALASNRRTPPQTPLDRADITAVAMKVGTSGLIEITTEPFDGTDEQSRTDYKPKPQSLLTYDPSKRSWTGPTPIKEPEQYSNAFTPLTAAGRPKAYKKQRDSNVWTLQLAREEMPKVRIPIEFFDPDERAPASAMDDAIGAEWYWVPQGYFFIKRRPFADSLVYFIPQAELDAYLDAHVPEESETGSAPPMPTKAAIPR